MFLRRVGRALRHSSAVPAKRTPWSGHARALSKMSSETPSQSSDGTEHAARERGALLSAYCFGDGKLCCLGRSTGYSALVWPDVDPLDIPLGDGRRVFVEGDGLDLMLASGREENEGNQEMDELSGHGEVCHNGDDRGENRQGSTASAADTAEARPPIAARAASGWAHSAILSTAGELWVWGRTHDMRNILRVNRKSQLTSWLMGTDRSVDVLTPAPVEVPGVGMPVARGPGVEPLDVQAYALQLRDDDGGGGEEQLPAFDDRVVGIACSAALTGCFTESGRAFLFGDNRVGQCGNGIPSEREWNPVRLRGLPRGERVTALSLGYQHGLVATASGRVYAWGKGDRGQLGIGGKRTENKATALPLFDKAPVRVPTVDELSAHVATLKREAHVTKLDAGQIHDMHIENDRDEGSVGGDRVIVVVDDEGHVLHNGNNNENGNSSPRGRQGSSAFSSSSSSSDAIATKKRRHDNTASNNLVFTEEGLLRGERPRAIDVGCGFAHSAALSSEGVLYVWGKFMAVHLSDESDRHADEYLPRKLDIPAPVVKFACAQFHTAALDATGRIWLVGMRSKTEVAPDAEAIDRFCPEPYEVPGTANLNIVAMRGGWSATTLIDAEGRLYEVSFNGIQGPSTEFENVFVRDIAPGFKHTVVVCEDR